MAEKGWQCSAGPGAGRVTVPRAGDTSAICTPTGIVDSADTEHGGRGEGGRQEVSAGVASANITHVLPAWWVTC